MRVIVFSSRAAGRNADIIYNIARNRARLRKQRLESFKEFLAAGACGLLLLATFIVWYLVLFMLFGNV